MVPFMFSILLGMCIITGGQYLLQGVSEEKESRILESLLCALSPEDLLAGKLLGLGATGLTLVGVWMGAGVALGGPMMALADVQLPPALLALAVVYFLLGYLFYAGLMTGIGAVTNNMREAQQFAMMFTFANFVPFILLTTLLSKPDGPLAVGLSLFPPDRVHHHDAAAGHRVGQRPGLADRHVARVARARGLAGAARRRAGVPHRAADDRQDAEPARDLALGSRRQVSGGSAAAAAGGRETRGGGPAGWSLAAGHRPGPSRPSIASPFQWDFRSPVMAFRKGTGGGSTQFAKATLSLATPPHR